MKKYLTLSIIVSFIACSTNKKMASHTDETFLIPKSNPAFDKQGHRGCRGLMPENTIPAMIKALELGVTTLEMDASVTHDKKIILSHEPFFNHDISTKPDGSFIAEKEERNYNMYKMDYDSIIKYDVGLKAHPRFAKQQKLNAVKPLLSDVFDSVINYCSKWNVKLPFFNIETKCTPATDDIYHPKPGEFVELLMKVINQKKMQHFVIIQSFDFRSLQYLHQRYPEVQTAMLIEDFDKTTFEDQIKKSGFTANIYSPHYSLVTEELVQKCHAKNMRIIPWTVNDKPTMERLKKLLVDGIISDYPDLF